MTGQNIQFILDLNLVFKHHVESPLAQQTETPNRYSNVNLTISADY